MKKWRFGPCVQPLCCFLLKAKPKNGCSDFLRSDCTQHLFPVDYIVIIIVTAEKKTSLLCTTLKLTCTRNLSISPGLGVICGKKKKKEPEKEKKNL